MNKVLLELAKNSISERLFNKDIIDKEALLNEYSSLKEKKATFVTLMLNDSLRGCIGTLSAHRTLLEDIIYNAKAAAFSDPRFMPLTIEEFELIKIEISILTEPKPLEYSSVKDLREKIRVGIDGVVLKHKGRQATFLPMVWEELNSFEDFFVNLAFKAGLDIDCLEESAEIYIYQAEKI